MNRYENRRGWGGRPDWKALGLVVAVAFVAACEQETPTEVGGDELPDAAVTTFELLLPASEFLLSDAVVSGFGRRGGAATLLVARDYASEFDAHALLEFSAFPRTVTYTRDSVAVVDSTPTYVNAELVMRIDTTALGLDPATTDSAVTLELYTVAEQWSGIGASWTVRSAIAGDTLLWSTPGGTTGALLGSRTWTPGDTVLGDSIVFPLDSATVAALRDTTTSNGVLLRTPDAGVRARVGLARLRLFVRPSAEEDRDTLVTTAVGAREQALLYQPQPPPPEETRLRTGGGEGWRSFLLFDPGLFDEVVPCPGSPDCSVRLSAATINHAELLLAAAPIEPIFRPFGTFSLEARPLLGGADVPLARAPVGDTVGVARGIPPSAFTEAADSVVRLTVTGFLVQVQNALAEGSEVPRGISLSTIPDRLPFGFGSFEGAPDAMVPEPENSPRLRLIITARPEVEP